MIWLTLLVFNILTDRLVYMYISTGVALINKSLDFQRGNDVDTLRMADLTLLGLMAVMGMKCKEAFVGSLRVLLDSDLEEERLKWVEKEVR